MNSAAASSSQRLSISAGWPSAIERIMTSRAGKRGLRPSLLCGAKNASLRPMRGPAGREPRANAAARSPPRVRLASPRTIPLLAEESRKPPLHVRLVVPAQRLVGDFCGRLEKPALERRALFGRVETLAVGLAHEEHLRERPRGAQMLGHRGRPASPDEIVRVLAFGQEREAQALARADHAAAPSRSPGKPRAVRRRRRRSTGSARPPSPTGAGTDRA